MEPYALTSFYRICLCLYLVGHNESKFNVIFFYEIYINNGCTCYMFMYFASNDDDYFTIKLHHGERFCALGHTVYVGGSVDHFD